MQKKTIFIALVFILALTAGPALAADNTQFPGMKASNVIGQKIVSSDGQDLGTVQDLYVGDNGQVQYVILSRGGVMGAGNTLVPIPWQAANLHEQGDHLVASVTQQKLDNAPTFSEDNWAQLSQPGYEHQVNGYYGTPAPAGMYRNQPQQSNPQPRTNVGPPDANPNAASTPGAPYSPAPK